MEPSFKIGNRTIGRDYPPLVIAEIGINHGGSLDVAIAMADSALVAGAEVVKHQTHICEDEMSEEARLEIPDHTPENVYETIHRCSLSESDERALQQHVMSKGSIFISTPFSRAALLRLETFNVPAYKIGSGECNNYPLVELIAQTGKPIILSTGMNTIDTIKPSVEIFRKYGNPFAILHCTNVYPTPPSLVRLDALTVLQNEFPDAVVGLSDHTTTNYTCFGAVSLGASILEKHFTDDKNRDGPDIPCSIDGPQLSDLILGSNIIHTARGEYKGPVEEEASIISFAFASVVATRPISSGEAFTKDNIWVKRPGSGDFSAEDYESLLGQFAARAIGPGKQIQRSDVVARDGSK